MLHELMYESSLVSLVPVIRFAVPVVGLESEEPERKAVAVHGGCVGLEEFLRQFLVTVLSV